MFRLSRLIKEYKDLHPTLKYVATLGRLNSDKLKSYNPEEYKLVIIDTYIRVLDHFKVFDRDSHVMVWGCSATLRRNDTRKLSRVFQEIVYSKPFVGMIVDKWLCNFKFMSVKTTCDLKGLKTTDGDFVVSELSRRVNEPKRNALVVSSYIEFIQSKGFKSTVVFAADIAHINTLVDQFHQRGIPCASIHSKLSPSERQHILNQFSENTISVIVNCGILTEGVDIPRIDSILIARPTRSTILLQQMLGRGLRMFPGKEFCMIVDFVDVVDRKQILASVPELMGVEVGFDFKGDDALTIAEEYTAVKAQLEKKDKEEVYDGPIEIRVTHHGYIVDFNSTTQEDITFTKHTPFKWIRTSPTELSIRVQKSRYLVIEHLHNQFTLHMKYFITQFKFGKRSFFWKKVHVGVEACIEDAFCKAQDFISEKYGVGGVKLYRDAAWRAGRPSRAQLEALHRMKTGMLILRKSNGAFVECNGVYGDEAVYVMIEKSGCVRVPEACLLTSGMASDLILKHTLSSAKKWNRFQMTRHEADEAVLRINRIQNGSLD